MAKSVISDMDGVIYRGKNLIPGADRFVATLQQKKIKFLFLTNNSQQTTLDLKLSLEKKGIKNLREENFITSAMATAMFLKSQKPAGKVYVIGGGGLINELYNAGFSVSESDPDYVVVGKTTTFTFETIKKAVTLIRNGAKFIGTNPDVIDPVEDGVEPACGTILSAIQTASGRKPYVVGKPNALMMTLATRKLGVHADDTVMIGDRMDTDIVGGLEAGMTTCLVLSGVTCRDDLNRFPYKPDYIFDSVAAIDPEAL
ncbi:MAG: HAD family hydrolase [Chitinivibrionales bacterium]|nr:HAD family hydrolase [Chitinivibrionales bacterium]